MQHAALAVRLLLHLSRCGVRSMCCCGSVSSVDYQKISGLRPHDGPPSVWDDSEHTQIPALVRHVQAAALARRKVLSLRRCEAMVAFGESLTSVRVTRALHSALSRVRACTAP